jgi:hypothetical protein
MQDIQVQAIIAFLFPVVLQLAKNSQNKLLAWVSNNKPRVSVITSALVALLTNMGFSFAHTTHSVTIGWVDLPTAVHGLVAFLTMTGIQLAGQHLSYEAFWQHILPQTKA